MLGIILTTLFVCAILGGLLNGGMGFILGLVFGPLGVIVAGFLRTPEAPVRQPPSHVGERKCPDCAEFVKAEAIKCRFCGAALTPIVAPVAAPRVIPSATCPHCAATIPGNATRCAQCLERVVPVAAT